MKKRGNLLGSCLILVDVKATKNVFTPFDYSSLSEATRLGLPPLINVDVKSTRNNEIGFTSFD